MPSRTGPHRGRERGSSNTAQAGQCAPARPGSQLGPGARYSPAERSRGQVPAQAAVFMAKSTALLARRTSMPIVICEAVNQAEQQREADHPDAVTGEQHHTEQYGHQPRHDVRITGPDDAPACSGARPGAPSARPGPATAMAVDVADLVVVIGYLPGFG